MQTVQTQIRLLLIRVFTACHSNEYSIVYFKKQMQKKAKFRLTKYRIDVWNLWTFTIVNLAHLGLLLFVEIFYPQKLEVQSAMHVKMVQINHHKRWAESFQLAYTCSIVRAILTCIWPNFKLLWYYHIKWIEKTLIRLYTCADWSWLSLALRILKTHLSLVQL